MLSRSAIAQLFGAGGEVKSKLPEQRAELAREQLRRLLPGYVRSFIEQAAPLLGLRIDGDIDGFFSFAEARPNALDPFWLTLDFYPPESRNRLTLHKPKEDDHAIFLHPGEPLFERLRELVCARFARDALRGGVFIDAYAPRPYFFHLALFRSCGRRTRTWRHSATDAPVEYRLVGMRQEEGGQIEECPVENLLLLRGANEGIGGGVPLAVRTFANTVGAACEHAQAFALQGIARPIADRHRQALLDSLPEREGFITAGYRYEEDQLLAQRVMKAAQAREGDSKAAADLATIKDRQRALETLKEQALATIHREPELISSRRSPVPCPRLGSSIHRSRRSQAPRRRSRKNRGQNSVGVRARAGMDARDVSTPPLARAAGLSDNPGFDLLSTRPAFGATKETSTVFDERAIEVKGRAGNWRYRTDRERMEPRRAICAIATGCTSYLSAEPRILDCSESRTPFMKLIANAKGGVIIDEDEIFVGAVREPPA